MSISNKLSLALSGIGLLAATGSAPAQGNLTAAQWTGTAFGTPITNAVGWSFVPNSDLDVSSILSTADQVSFWTATFQLLGTYNFSGPYGTADEPPTTFSSIAPLHLSAGQTYYVSTRNADNSSYYDFIFGAPSGITNAPSQFTVSSALSQFASYTIDNSGQWIPSVTPPGNADYFLLGPDFQFVTVPEPSSAMLLTVGGGVAAMIFRRLRQPRQ